MNECLKQAHTGPQSLTLAWCPVPRPMSIDFPAPHSLLHVSPGIYWYSFHWTSSLDLVFGVAERGTCWSIPPFSPRIKPLTHPTTSGPSIPPLPPQYSHSLSAPTWRNLRHNYARDSLTICQKISILLGSSPPGSHQPF